MVILSGATGGCCGTRLRADSDSRTVQYLPTSGVVFGQKLRSGAAGAARTALQPEQGAVRVYRPGSAISGGMETQVLAKKALAGSSAPCHACEQTVKNQSL